MEVIIISILVFILIFISVLPIDEIAHRKNLHKLILFLDKQEDNSNISKKTLKEKFIILSEKIYAKTNIKISQEKYEKYERKLILSNLNNELNVETILGMKILSSIAMFCYFMLLASVGFSPIMFFISIIGVILGFYCPDSIINIRIKKRQLELQNQLPSILKTLAITTEAGLNFWEAIKEVCDVKNGVLVYELKNMLDEINMGILQKDALIKLSERCKVTEITIFVFTIIQSLEKGSAGITKALNEQADEVWSIRKNKAKELGQKASIKLFFSMLIFVFPSLLIFLLGPAILSILRLFINN